MSTLSLAPTIPRPKVILPHQIIWHPGPAIELIRDPLTPKQRRLLDRLILFASGKSDYAEAKVKNLFLGAVAFTSPTPIFFGLWGTAASIGDASHGGTAGEVSGGSYVRTSVTNNTTNFATVTTGAKVNSTDIVFAAATANWNSSATINQVGILDGNAGTSGDNLVLWGDITVPKTVLTGDQAKILTNDLSYTED